MWGFKSTSTGSEAKYTPASGEALSDTNKLIDRVSQLEAQVKSQGEKLQMLADGWYTAYDTAKAHILEAVTSTVREVYEHNSKSSSISEDQAHTLDARTPSTEAWYEANLRYQDDPSSGTVKVHQILKAIEQGDVEGFGSSLRVWMDERKVAINSLAKRLGVVPQTVQNWRACKNIPNYQSRIRLINWLKQQDESQKRAKK